MSAEGDFEEADASTDTGRVQPGMRVQYQLVGSVDTEAAADLFVIDLFSAQPGEMEALHDRGRTVVAYVSAGTLESWRPDVDRVDSGAIGKPLSAFPNERWLDVRAASVRELLASRLDLAAAKGFDGALMSSLAAYREDTGFSLTAADQVEYNLWLADRAAAAGLQVGTSSDWEHAEQLAESYGFAFHLDCLANNRCGELEPYGARGRAVFNLETSGNRDEVCAEAARQDVPTTLKRDGFDDWFFVCP